MELDEEHVEEEEKGVKKEEMARVVGTCIGHTEPGRRVARSAPRPYCTRGPTPFKETKEKKTGAKALSRNKIIQIFSSSLSLALLGRQALLMIRSVKYIWALFPHIRQELHN